MQDEILRVENVSKEYKLGEIGTTTLREDLQRLHAKIHHQDDPTSKIGTMTGVKGEKFLALNNVSFSVNKGERIGIIGHNGAGKSTLLKLISRITAPTSGDIWLNSRIASMLEVGTGFHAELTGRENIYMNGAILGMKKKEIDEKIEDIIEFSECRQFIDTPVKRYSSGMYVKLAFSVAAHLDAELMIMDEVLAVGDMAFQKKCLDKMNDVSRDEGRTILYVSHNMNTIRQLCDRCIVLEHGKIIFDGDVGTGIDIYMGTKEETVYPTFYDFSNAPRRNRFGKEIKVESFRFLDRESAEYTTGEKIAFEIVFSSEISRNDLRFVLRVYDKNGSQTIGSSLSEPISIQKGDGQKVRFAFSTQGLMEGTFSFDLEIIQYSVEGRYYTFDSIKTLMPVKIIDADEDLYWAAKYWGNIRLKDLEIVDRVRN